MTGVSVPDDKVDVVYTAADLRVIYRACRSCRRNALIALIAVPAFFAVLAALEGKRGADLVYEAIPYALIVICCLAGIYWFCPWNAIRARKRNGWDRPMRVELSDAGVVVQHPSQQALFYWSDVKDVTTKDRRLLIFTSPSCAIILPRNSFVDDTQFFAWERRAKELWKAKRPNG